MKHPTPHLDELTGRFRCHWGSLLSPERERELRSAVQKDISEAILQATTTMTESDAHNEMRLVRDAIADFLHGEIELGDLEWRILQLVKASIEAKGTMKP